jgi:hypothetical protein
VNEDESLRRYGLSPAAGDLADVREILAVQTARERRPWDCIPRTRPCCPNLVVLSCWRLMEITR